MSKYLEEKYSILIHRMLNCRIYNMFPKFRIQPWGNFGLGTAIGDALRTNTSLTRLDLTVKGPICPLSLLGGGHNDVSEYFGHINISLNAVLRRTVDNRDRTHSLTEICSADVNNDYMPKNIRNLLWVLSLLPDDILLLHDPDCGTMVDRFDTWIQLKTLLIDSIESLT